MGKFKWCAIDAEGDVGKQGLLGVAFYSDIEAIYEVRHDAIRTRLEHYAQAGYTFLAHNAEYDLSVIFWQLAIPMKAIYYNDRFNRGEWRYDENSIHCQLWDTWALSGNIPLSKLGSAIGYPKYPTPQKLLGNDPDRYTWKCEAHSTWECEECYAVRDAEIIYRFMVGLEETLAGYGVEPRRRLAGLAQEVWKALDSPKNITLTRRAHRELSRLAYHGGRCETFKLGFIEPLYTADVSSMYPSVMQEAQFPDPNALIDQYDCKSYHHFINSEGVIECTIKIPPMYVPPLPYSDNGQLKYPIGTLHGVWTLAEIRYALSLGCILVHTHRVLYSRFTLQPFDNFISVLWAMREAYQSTNDPRQIFAKLLMNNLYGRLGMREGLEKKEIYLSEPDTVINFQHISGWFTQDGELYLTDERPQPHRDTWANVMWAAQITATARIKLHQFAVLQGDNLVYCDTDSIFSRAPINGTSTGLGQLRPDGTYGSAIIAAPKLYALRDNDGRWTAKAKGVSRETAWDFLKGEVVTFSRPITPKAQARRKVKAGTWLDISRGLQYAPSRRQVLNPENLLNEYGYSETGPPVCLPS